MSAFLRQLLTIASNAKAAAFKVAEAGERRFPKPRIIDSLLSVGLVRQLGLPLQHTDAILQFHGIAEFGLQRIEIAG